MLSGFFLTGLLAATALAAPQASSTDVPKLNCDGQGDTSKAFEAHRVFAARERNYTGPHPQINVDVYMHVLLGSAEDATLTPDFLKSQVDGLNDHFKPANISFTLRDAERIDDATLAKGTNDEVKKMLHAGTNSDLNIYYVKNIDEGGEGITTLPTKLLEGPDGPALDGCLLQKFVAVWDKWRTRTLAHEVGHWFGLLHTFQDRCEGGDDFIDDTPPTPSSCYNQLNSCPGRNYMGVASRGAEFTAGQITRMHSFWTEYRSKNTTKVETALTAMEPIRNQTRLPFYPYPQNRRLVYQSCRPKPDGSVDERREDYCGTEAYCRWKLYELAGQKFDDEADCLGARTRLEKAPWMEPQKEEHSKQLCEDSKSPVSETVCGTEAYCKAYEQGSRQVVDARNVTGRGQFSSATDCLASRQDPPASETAPSPDPSPSANPPVWKPFLEPAEGDRKIEACGEPQSTDAKARSEECLGTVKFCQDRYMETEEKFATAFDCKDSRQLQ